MNIYKGKLNDWEYWVRRQYNIKGCSFWINTEQQLISTYIPYTTRYNVFLPFYQIINNEYYIIKIISY